MKLETMKKLANGVLLLGICSAVLIVAKPFDSDERVKKELRDWKDLRSSAIQKIKLRISELKA